MQKTSQFKTQCKGDISHALETAKITVLYATVCKTPVKVVEDRPTLLQCSPKNLLLATYHSRPYSRMLLRTSGGTFAKYIDYAIHYED